jgi:uncharacterized protein YdeI (BOF family)
MKRLLIAMTLVAVASTAFAQGKRKQDDAPPPKPDEKQIQRSKEEAAAAAASARMPDSKEKYDPWKIGK